MGIISVTFESPVDVKTHVFAPGETFRGKVRYVGTLAQEKVDDIVIVFKGKLASILRTHNGRGRSKTEENIDLFRIQKNLFRGPYTMQRTTLEYPFEFTFPETFRYERDGIGGGSSNGQSGVRSPLPPTFAYETGIGRRRGECFAAYVLKVKLNHGSLTRSQEEDVPLLFMPYASDAPRSAITTRFVFPTSFWQSSSLRSEKLSFSQKLFGNPGSRDPSISFSGTLTLPDSLAPDDSVPLYFSFGPGRSGTSNTQPCTLVLRGVQIQLVAYTSISAKRVLYGSMEASSRDIVGQTPYWNVNQILTLHREPILVTPDFRLGNFGQMPEGMR